MPDTRPTWAVVATVDEAPALLLAFVAWHLHLGASEVWLYFDRPDDPAAAIFEDRPQVQVIRCDAAYWARGGTARPDKHQVRQARNATDAYGQASADWVLHCDADEFLWPGADVAAALGRVSPAIDCAIVPVAERVFVAGAEAADIFAGVFRRPDKGGADKALPTLRGLTGHAIGKSFARTGRGLSVSVHRPKRGAGEIPAEPLQGVELLHFDGLTPLHWIYKLLRKADAFAHHNGMVPSAHRQNQIDAVLHDPQAALALHDRLKCADSDDLARLEDQGLLLRAGFDPRAAISAVFDSCPDLGTAAFDAWLLQEKAQAGLGPFCRVSSG